MRVIVTVVLNATLITLLEVENRMAYETDVILVDTNFVIEHLKVTAKKTLEVRKFKTKFDECDAILIFAFNLLKYENNFKLIISIKFPSIVFLINVRMRPTRFYHVTLMFL